jgi:hypothetical protein
MSSVKYSALKQLQAFIFADEIAIELRLFGQRNFKGVPMLFKLNQTHALRLTLWPFSGQGEGAFEIMPVDGTGQNAEVIPISSAIDQAQLHSAIALSGKGFHLLDQKER